jgi:ketoreductase
MSEKTAFITGGSSGIGLGIARALLQDGYAVTIVARREAKLRAAVDELSPFGEVHHFVADFRVDAEIEAAAESHRTRFGRLHVLVNNAGVGLGRPLEQTTGKLVDLVLAVNLRAAITCTRVLADLLVKSAPSHVLNVSSYTGLHGQAGMTAYSASKAGVIGFTEAFQAEYASRGVKATALCPAFVDTAMSDTVRDLVDTSELIRVDDVVAIVMALLSLSPGCTVPTVSLQPLANRLQGWQEQLDRWSRPEQQAVT